MTVNITFTIPGQPSAWQRTGKNGKRVINTKHNLNAKNAIASYGKTAMGSRSPFKGAVKVSIIFVTQWPQSTTKKRMAMPNGFYKTTKPDVDNCCKQVLDALNGICFVDDNQVAQLYSEKIHSDNGSWTSVAIEPLWEDERGAA